MNYVSGCLVNENHTAVVPVSNYCYILQFCDMSAQCRLWSESSLSKWRKRASLVISEQSGHAAREHRLIRIFAGRACLITLRNFIVLYASGHFFPYYGDNKPMCGHVLSQHTEKDSGQTWSRYRTCISLWQTLEFTHFIQGLLNCLTNLLLIFFQNLHLHLKMCEYIKLVLSSNTQTRLLIHAVWSVFIPTKKLFFRLRRCKGCAQMLQDTYYLVVAHTYLRFNDFFFIVLNCFESFYEYFNCVSI